jgi:hypothetical protein
VRLMDRFSEGGMDRFGEGGADDRRPSISLRDALIRHDERALRLSGDHYLVRWRLRSQLWCVIDMSALDVHAEDCAAFRGRQRCAHVDLIRQLCTEEREAGTTRMQDLTDPSDRSRPAARRGAFGGSIAVVRR